MSSTGNLNNRADCSTSVTIVQSVTSQSLELLLRLQKRLLCDVYLFLSLMLSEVMPKPVIPRAVFFAGDLSVFRSRIKASMTKVFLK